MFLKLKPPPTVFRIKDKESEGTMDKQNKVIASLSYFSVFFAPFLLPIAIYFIVDHTDVKSHAKKALVSHIIPFLSVITLIGMIIYSGLSYISEAAMFSLVIGGFLLIGIINLFVVIWNIVKGIKLLTTLS